MIINEYISVVMKESLLASHESFHICNIPIK